MLSTTVSERDGIYFPRLDLYTLSHVSVRGDAAVIIPMFFQNRVFGAVVVAARRKHWE